MSTPQLIRSDWIRSNPQSLTIDNIRPNVAGTWKEPRESEPTITIKLVETGDEPIPVRRIQLTGNVPSYVVFYKPTNDVEEFIPLSISDDNKPQVCI